MTLYSSQSYAEQNWLLEHPNYWVKKGKCHVSKISPLLLVEKNGVLRGEFLWTWNNKKGKAIITGKRSGSQLLLSMPVPKIGGMARDYVGKKQSKTRFTGQVSVQKYNCPSQPFTLTAVPKAAYYPKIKAKQLKNKDIRYVNGVPVMSQHKRFANFDKTMTRFMHKHYIYAATLAVSHHGHPWLARGYGYSNPQHTKPLPPDTLMRIASITKPFTAAAIHHLIREKKLDLDDPMLSRLSLRPFKNKWGDKRLKKITINHLLHHKGGWDRDTAFDPAFTQIQLAKEMGVTQPLSSADILHYMLNKPLQFSPNKKKSYSNIGYLFLGEVIQQVTQKDYYANIKDYILDPIGIKHIYPAQTLVKHRHPKEIKWYTDLGYSKSIYNHKKFVRTPNGNFHLPALGAAAGLIASAPDLVKFAQHYWVNGLPRKQGKYQNKWMFGSLAGTRALLRWRTDGVDYAVLFNQRRDPLHLSQKLYKNIRQQLDKVANAYSTTTRYAAISYSPKTGAYGFSYDYQSKYLADQRALKYCDERAEDCRLVYSFYNSCAAFATATKDKKIYAYGLGNSEKKAKKRALAYCHKKEDSCKVRVSLCSHKK